MVLRLRRNRFPRARPRCLQRYRSEPSAASAGQPGRVPPDGPGGKAEGGAYAGPLPRPCEGRIHVGLRARYLHGRHAGAVQDHQDGRRGGEVRAEEGLVACKRRIRISCKTNSPIPIIVFVNSVCARQRRCGCWLSPTAQGRCLRWPLTSSQ